MTARQLIYGDGARDRIRGGVDYLADAVKVTLDPRGRTVILDQPNGPPQIVNSGVVVRGRPNRPSWTTCCGSQETSAGIASPSPISSPRCGIGVEWVLLLVRRSF